MRPRTAEEGDMSGPEDGEFSEDQDGHRDCRQEIESLRTRLKVVEEERDNHLDAARIVIDKNLETESKLRTAEEERDGLKESLKIKHFSSCSDGSCDVTCGTAYANHFDCWLKERTQELQSKLSALTSELEKERYGRECVRLEFDSMCEDMKAEQQKLFNKNSLLSAENSEQGEEISGLEAALENGISLAGKFAALQKSLDEQAALLSQKGEALRLESRRINWLDWHCCFVASEPYCIGPYKLGELRKMADDGIAQQASFQSDPSARRASTPQIPSQQCKACKCPKVSHLEVLDGLCEFCGCDALLTDAGIGEGE